MILAGGALILLISGVLFGIPEVQRAAHIGAAARARLQLERWVVAANAYQEAHGRLPEVANEALLETLGADETARRAMMPNGGSGQKPEALDPWGTPWQIRDGELIEVRSAGPNRRFGDEDDLSSRGIR
jgi:hypothetical protein